MNDTLKKDTLHLFSQIFSQNCTKILYKVVYIDIYKYFVNKEKIENEYKENGNS